MHEQTLYKVLPDYIKPKIINKKNRYNKWEYGYNKEFDVIVISKTGKIGEIYEIQNLKIALPKAEDVQESKDNKWKPLDYPKELQKIKTIFDWKNYDEGFKEKWYDYIDNEFKKKE